MDDLALDFRGNYNTSRGGVGAVEMPIGEANVRFYARQVLVPFKSQEMGRPVTREAVYVHVAFPGERDEIDREATPTDKRRYARYFEAFEAGRMDIVEGMPLSGLFPANPEIVDVLRMSKVHTVEQLADMSDTAIQNLGMGGSEWQARAKRFLSLSNDAARIGQIERKQRDQDAAIEKANEENDRLRAELAEMKAAAEKKAKRLLPAGE